MSVQELALPDLPGIAKDLFSKHNIVVITHECGDLDWAVAAAWSIARAAATTGRRTAIVDLDLESPSLHKRARDPQETGIVDAFLFGASLQHVASKEDDPNLHFIGVGTPPLDPEEVWASDRWQRLSRGFEKEDAILLVFLPPTAMDKLVLAPDLILVLSPGGVSLGGPRSPQLRSAIDRGVSVIVVKDTHRPAAERQATESLHSTASAEQLTAMGPSKSGNRRRTLLSVLGVVVAATVTVFVLILSGRGAVQAPNQPENRASQPPATADTTPRTAEALIDPEGMPQTGADSAQDSGGTEELTGIPAVPPGSDSLHLSIQVSAWSQLSSAREHLARFYAAGLPATITVVRRDSARVWYRVVVGALGDFRSASQLRQRLRADGLIGSTVGVLLRTPLALLLETHPDTISGWQAVRGLRESGIPAYIVSMPDGSVQVLLGAFESPDQAELSDSVLVEAGSDLSRSLVTRVGITR